MGWQLTMRAYMLGGALSALDHAVLGRLAHSANDDDGRDAWPAVATIATETGYTPRAVQQSLKRLLHGRKDDSGAAVAPAYIAVQSPGSHKRLSTTYRLLLERLPELVLRTERVSRMPRDCETGSRTDETGSLTGERGSRDHEPLSPKRRMNYSERPMKARPWPRTGRSALEGKEGMLVMDCCRDCGAVIEGRIVGGRAMYPACPCAVDRKRALLA